MSATGELYRKQREMDMQYAARDMKERGMSELCRFILACAFCVFIAVEGIFFLNWLEHFGRHIH